MNQEEQIEKSGREERYAESQDDVRVIRKELNRLTAAVGELVNALKGDDFGNDGLIKRVRAIEIIASEFTDRIDDFEMKTDKRMDELGVKADKRINLLVIISTLGGAFVGILIKWVFDSISKK